MQVTQTNTQLDQYVTHAQSLITQLVASMESCFAIVRDHQHGISVVSLALIRLISHSY